MSFAITIKEQKQLQEKCIGRKVAQKMSHQWTLATAHSKSFLCQWEMKSLCIGNKRKSKL